MTEQQDEAEALREKLQAQAVKLLARREHSRLELALKLAKRQYGQADIDAVLDICEERGWLDDERFAEIYLRQRKEAGYGPLRISAELHQRGIRRDPEALTAVSEAEWRTAATGVRARKFGLTPVPDWTERGRQGRFLSQRGYSMSQIEYALDQLSPDGSEA